MAGALASLHRPARPGSVRALGGRRQVEIVAVPDDEHVTLRIDDGAEVTVALAEIGEANLIDPYGASGQTLAGRDDGVTLNRSDKDGWIR